MHTFDCSPGSPAVNPCGRIFPLFRKEIPAARSHRAELERNPETTRNQDRNHTAVAAKDKRPSSNRSPAVEPTERQAARRRRQEKQAALERTAGSATHRTTSFRRRREKKQPAPERTAGSASQGKDQPPAVAAEGKQPALKQTPAAQPK
ncbi:MAG TPA: hypothetical protein VFT67_16605 [Jatrophihabitantaceae bacterium]|nr:hypothetical protein [Jatrophihabitantaceae bacterium]